MLAGDNYSYQKRKRELAKKKKREEKIQRKLDKKNIKLKETSGQVFNEDAAGSPSLPPASEPLPDKETL